MSLSRRYSFPTWSWAGWKGAVEYPGRYDLSGGQEGGELMAADRSNFDTIFWPEDRNENLVTVEEFCNRSQQRHSILEISHYIHVDAWTF